MTGRSKKKPRWRQLRWMVLFGGVLVAVAAAYVHFYLYLPIGSGPAGPQVEAKEFEQKWTEQQVLLVGIGDSVTAGLGSTAGKSYFERLVGNPPDEFPEMQGRCLSGVLPNLQTLNIALSSSNSLEHMQHIEKRLPAQDDSVIADLTRLNTRAQRSQRS